MSQDSSSRSGCEQINTTSLLESTESTIANSYTEPDGIERTREWLTENVHRLG